jgi:hypothetical protein
LAVAAAVVYLLPEVVAGGLLLGAADLVGGSEAVGAIAGAPADVGSAAVDGVGSLIGDAASIF